MPLLNKTGMTDGERELLRRWVEQGAPTDDGGHVSSSAIRAASGQAYWDVRSFSPVTEKSTKPLSREPFTNTRQIGSRRALLPSRSK